MKTFTEKLNFSSSELENSIKINNNKDVNHYETLCKYCADHNIDLENVSDEEFEAAAEIMKNHGSSSLNRDDKVFFFSYS